MLDQLDWQIANEPPANAMTEEEVEMYERWMNEEEAKFYRAKDVEL